MSLLELARTMQADREREIRGRERGAARMSTGRRHPAGPEQGVAEEPALIRRSTVVVRPATT
jgi:hypothetical protein